MPLPSFDPIVSPKTYSTKMVEETARELFMQYAAIATAIAENYWNHRTLPAETTDSVSNILLACGNMIGPDNDE